MKHGALITDGAQTLAIGPCVRCGAPFTFDPERVVSLTVDGEREPICLPCVTDMDTERAILRTLRERPTAPLSMRDIRYRLYDLGLPDRMGLVPARVQWLLQTGEVVQADDAGRFLASPRVLQLPETLVAPIQPNLDAYARGESR